jgi:hypothetical protein
MPNLCVRATRSNEHGSSRSGRLGFCTKPPTAATPTGSGASWRPVRVTARDERFGATALDWAPWTKQDAVVAYFKSVMKEAE